MDFQNINGVLEAEKILHILYSIDCQIFVSLSFKNFQLEFFYYFDFQYNTTQCNTIQYNTIQYNTIQYNTIQYNTIQ